MSPVFQNRNVTFGWGDISTFGERCGKTFAPGMIRSRFLRQSFFLESQVKLFGRNDLSLLSLLLVNGVGQGFAIIQECDFLLGIEANGHLRFSQGLGGTLGLNLVDDLLKLQSEVFGKGTSFLPGQDMSEILFGC